MQKPLVLFIDAVSPFAYTGNSVSTGHVPGTERIVVRLAEGLAQTHEVRVISPTRTIVEKVADVTYGPDALMDGTSPAAIVVLRRTDVLANIRKRFPTTPLFLWVHDWQWEQKPPWARWHLRRALPTLDARIVCVSAAHRANVRWAWLQGQRWHLPLAVEERLTFIHHGVKEPPAAEHRTFDRNKLVFFSSAWSPSPPELSSPTARLDDVLRAFRHVRARLPEMELHYAYPEHGADQATRVKALIARTEGVVNRDRLTQDQVVDEMRTALCYFYPNRSCDEAFGLVFAESNAVGTPVLTSPIGAAPEVLRDGDQLVDCHDLDQIASKIARWRSGERPEIRLAAAFRYETMLANWRAVLSEPRKV